MFALLFIFLFGHSLSCHSLPGSSLASSFNTAASGKKASIDLSVGQDSLDQMIGRMIMVGFRGTSLSESDHILRDLTQIGVGGVILFDRDVPTGSPRRNIVGRDSLKLLINELRARGREGLLIAVDQEGGRVARLKPDRGFDRGRSPASLAKLGPDAVLSEARAQANQLADLGFNVNFAPVVDVNVNPSNPIIGRLERSFSANPEEVAQFGGLVVEAFREAGIISVLKHFPGHGSSESDSHLGFVDITRSWSDRELIPYRRLIQEGRVDAIMTAHVYNARLDEELPATLSKNVVSGILREELGYDGVVFSDDMQMLAIRDHYSLEQSVVLAVMAGVDILVFGNNAGIYDADIARRTHSILKKAVEDGQIPLQRIVESNRRIQLLAERAK